MDEMSQLVRDSESAAAVFFREKDTRFALVALGTDLCVLESRALLRQGYAFVMVVGVVDGRLAAAEYEQPAPEGDAVKWLRSLWALPDDRSELGPA